MCLPLVLLFAGFVNISATAASLCPAVRCNIAEIPADDCAEREPSMLRVSHKHPGAPSSDCTASAAAVWRRLRSGSGLPNAVAGQRLARAWWGAGCAIHGERHNVHIVAEGLFAARQFSALSHGQCGQQHHRNKIFLHFFILSFGGIRHTPPSHSGRGSSHLGNW